jgi:hypothetical protein
MIFWRAISQFLEVNCDIRFNCIVLDDLTHKSICVVQWQLGVDIVFANMHNTTGLQKFQRVNIKSSGIVNCFSLHNTCTFFSPKVSSLKTWVRIMENITNDLD